MDLSATSRRRQTLASLDAGGMNGTGKGGAGGRHSLAGGAPQRMSLAPARTSLRGGVGPSGAADAYGGMAAAAGMITPAVGPGKRQSVLSSVNRYSTANTGRGSLAGVRVTAGDIKDPRPLRDKAWQQSTINKIINYLVSAGYCQPLSAKTLQTPTAKDFQTIFKFLYSQIDPNFIFQKKFEEEVPVVLKAVKYPFVDQISKSQLYAIGSMHSWPTLLAMLSWLVELILCLERLDEDQEKIGLNQQSGLDGGGECPPQAATEKYFFDYLCQSYRQFLIGEDDFMPMEEEMAQKFESLNHDSVIEIEKLEKANEQLKWQLSEMDADESPLVAADKQRQVLQSDVEKFTTYIHHLENKRTKLQEHNSRVKQHVLSIEERIEQLRAEKRDVQAAVDAQEISPADVDRMTAEREELRKQIEVTAAHYTQMSKVSWEKEIAVQRRLDGLEALAAAYNRSVTALGLDWNEEFLAAVDAPTRTVPEGDVDDEEGGKPPRRSCTVEINVHATRPESMASLNLRSKLKPALQQLRETMATSLHASQNELIGLAEAVDRVVEQIADKRDGLTSLEHHLAQSTASYTSQKRACAKAVAASNAEMESMQVNLRQMKMEGSGDLIAAKQRRQKMTMEYDNIARKFQDNLDGASKELLQIVDELTTFKSHAQQSLAELERTAFEELEAARREASTAAPTGE